MLNKMNTLVSLLNPYYKNLNSKYSNSYLSGSEWFVGEDLIIWWNTVSTISKYRIKKEKLRYIISILLASDKDKILYNELQRYYKYT